jgi:hypothetical protein
VTRTPRPSGTIRGVVRGIAACVLLLALPAMSQDDAAVRRAERLARDAKKNASKAKELWKRFVFEAEKMEDDELKELVGLYEKAIDLYQRALEEHENPGLNAAILTLTRRVTQVRFLQMQRHFRERKPEIAPPKETPPPKPEERKPTPGEPEAKPEPKPAPKPETGPIWQRRIPGDDPLPELEESPADRRRGIQGVRNFLMNTYFAPQKFASLVDRCARCNGRGSVRTGRLKPDRTQERVPCGQCNASGYHLDVNNARKGHWLVHSPLYRSDSGKSSEWSARLADWRKDPRKVPEFLTRLRISVVDYHGLWAQVIWTEQGVTPDRKRFERERKEKLIRAGRRWFFYDEEYDKRFFRGDGEDDGED